MIASTAVTALRSSTAVTVLAIGFANAGLLSLAGTLGVILGTNIGTTVTTELISLQIGQAAMPRLSSLANAMGRGRTRQRTRASELRQVKNNLIRDQFYALPSPDSRWSLLAIQFMQSIGPTLQSLGVFQWFLDHASRSVLWGIGRNDIDCSDAGGAVIAMAMGLATSGACLRRSALPSFWARMSAPAPQRL